MEKGPATPPQAADPPIVIARVSDAYALARLIDVCRWWAVPTGIAMSVVAGFEASTGLIPLRTFDRELGAGWHGLAAEIETVRARLGVTTLITTSYAVTAWLSFYMPPGTRVCADQ